MDFEKLEENSEKLPSGKLNKAQEPEPEAVSFDKIVEQSKAQLAEETQAQTKRPVGRPPGSKKKKDPETSSMSSQDPVTEPRGNASSLNEELKPLLKDAIKTPFSLASNHFRNPLIEASDVETETPAHYLSKFLNLSMPELESKDPKKFNLYAFLISMLLLFLRKLPHFKKQGPVIEVVNSNPENQENNNSPQAVSNLPAISRPWNGVSAGDHFKPRGSY